MQYAGFWKRCSSVLIDFIILLPISFFILWLGSFSKNIHLILIIPHTILYFAYNIYMNANHGGTIGKLIVGIRIRKISGETIHYKEAFRRNIVDLPLSLVIGVMQAYTLFHINDHSYESLTWIKQAGYLYKNMPESYKPISAANQIWIWSELIVLLLNKKKRALHDFIAGTVVIDITKKADAEDKSIDGKLEFIISKKKVD